MPDDGMLGVIGGSGLCRQDGVGVGRRRIRYGAGTSMRPMLRMFHRDVAAQADLLAATARHLPLAGEGGCHRPLPPEYYHNQQETAHAGSAQ
jgi:hypothetical protein